ncbi:MAG: ComEA family DNA-binding protein [Clostridia bacterium]|nr:ComEA family DNA-binding protein [Clostridia bacterium]
MRSYYKQIKILAAIGICLIAAVLLTAAFTPKIGQKSFENKSVDTAVSTTAPESVQLFPVNVNTATQAQLQTIPGIGEKTAQAIVDYREAHGAFATVDELLQVSGIGEKTLESIKEYVCVE